MRAVSVQKKPRTSGRKAPGFCWSAKRVKVFLNRRHVGAQPSKLLRVCPLGLQFYASRKVPEFSVLAFRMNIAMANGLQEEVSCSGVVVHCQWDRESRLYRIWVKFIDLPDATKAQIKCMARAAKLTCPHCENY